MAEIWEDIRDILELDEYKEAILKEDWEQAHNFLSQKLHEMFDAGGHIMDKQLEIIDILIEQLKRDNEMLDLYQSLGKKIMKETKQMIQSWESKKEG